MPVTQRSYNIPIATPPAIINALEQALADLNWHSATPYGYLQTITNSPGSVVRSVPNFRYLVPHASTTGNGSGAMFDVSRNGQGGVVSVTPVTGGAGYRVFGKVASSAGVVFTVDDTTNIRVGQLVTKIVGTGTLLAGNNTVVVSVDGPTTFSVNVAPSVAFSGGASILLQDTCTISAASIGGSSVVHTDCAGTSGTATLTVLDPSNINVGQRVSGTGIGLYAHVTAIQGTTVTLSANHTAAITNGVTSVTFSDEILVTAATIAYQQGVTGTVSGLTVTGVVTDKNIPIGARVTVSSGPAFVAGSGTVYVSAIAGAGPYTLTLANVEGDFKGFAGTGTVTLDVKNGGTTGWFDDNRFTTPNLTSWGVSKIVNDPAKKLGSTFWLFNVILPLGLQFPVGGAQPLLYIRSSPGFNPNTDTIQGALSMDFVSVSTINNISMYNSVIQVCSSTAASVTLKTYQSSIDPNFVMFCFVEGNTCRSPFFISKYNGVTAPAAPWNLDDQFLGSSYEITPVVFNTNDVGLIPRTRLSTIPKRQAEAGYSNYNQVVATVGYTNTAWRTNSGSRLMLTPTGVYDDVLTYTRQPSDIQDNISALPSNVWKQLPINPAFGLPCPYYIPEDFILSEVPFKNSTLSDKVVVNAGVEEYTILQAAINQITFTALVFAARTT